MNIDRIMPCRRKANTRSALKKMSAFYFFQGHGDEVGASSAEITCAVDSAHLELSMDERCEEELTVYGMRGAALLFM